MEKTSNKMLMAQAREKLEGKWGTWGMVSLIYFLLTNMIPFLSDGTFFFFFLSGSFTLGLTIVALNTYNRKEIEIGQLFEGFKCYATGLVAYLLMLVYLFFWSLCWIIPMVVIFVGCFIFLAPPDNVYDSVKILDESGHYKMVMVGKDLIDGAPNVEVEEVIDYEDSDEDFGEDCDLSPEEFENKFGDVIFDESEDDFDEELSFVFRGENVTFGQLFFWLTPFLLILSIPYIRAFYSYSLTFFVVAEKPEQPASESLKESVRLMKGNRWKLFCLQFRFIGWIFLAVFLTLGIGLLWVIPYMQVATAEFYKDLSPSVEPVEEFNAEVLDAESKAIVG